MVGPVS